MIKGGVVTLSLAAVLLLSGVVDGSLREDITVEGIPPEGRMENPLNATVTHREGENIHVVWFLDGARVAEGRTIDRYVDPGIHNLTVVIEDDYGNSTSLTFILDPVPPPGWNEAPDNERNSVIFWMIFGAGGVLFAAASARVWLRKRTDGRN